MSEVLTLDALREAKRKLSEISLGTGGLFFLPESCRAAFPEGAPEDVRFSQCIPDGRFAVIPRAALELRPFTRYDYDVATEARTLSPERERSATTDAAPKETR